MSLFPPVRAATWFRLAAASLVLAVAAPLRADIVTITFDPGDPIGGLAVGTTLSNQYAALGVTFSPNAFTGAGGPTGDWGTNTNMTIVSSTGADVGGLGTPSLVSGNILRSFNGWLGEDGDASFLALFSTPISSFSATFAGIATASSTRIIAYNGATQVASVTATTTGQQVLSLSAATITSVAILPGDFFDWVGVDNITYNRLSAVPEPSPLLLSAVLGVPAALLAYRRRRVAEARA